MRFVMFFYLLMFTACVSIPSTSSLRGGGENTSVSSAPPTENDSAPLEIYLPYIGQGDATLIRTPSGKILLIDAGPPRAGRDRLLPFLRFLGISKIDTLLITHYDEDHIGGVTELLAGEDGAVGTKDDIQVGEAWDHGGDPLDPSPGFIPYLQTLVKAGIPRRVPEPGQSLELDRKLRIQVMAVNGRVWDPERDEVQTVDLSPTTYSGKENSVCLALLIEYGNFRYFTAGDLTGGGSPDGFLTADLETLVGNTVGQVDALHVDHHGSLTSSNPSFIASTHPEAVFIQAGINNRYGHPVPEVVERWKNIGAEVLSTAEGQGYLLTTLGDNFEIENL